MSLNFKERISLNWKFLVAYLIPIVLLPLVFIEDDTIITGTNPPRTSTKFRALYVIGVIALYWMLEVIPLAVTSLLPVVLFPLLSVMSTDEVSLAYMKETNMMFIGGLIIALAIEYCNLHRRIALRVLTLIGSSPIRLMFGIMLVSMGLSMWMSNTACSAMMVPIVLAVLDELVKTPEIEVSRTRRQSSVTAATGRRKSVTSLTLSTKEPIKTLDTILDTDTEDAEQEAKAAEREAHRINTKRMLLFATAYACNIGGTGVITGTGSNLVFQGKIKEVDVDQDGKYTDITFMTWMAFNVVPMLANTFLAFVYLVWKYFGIPNWKYWPVVSLLVKRDESSMEEKTQNAKNEAVMKILMAEYKKLGKITFHEMGIGFLFFCVIMLWLFRDPRFMSGWSESIDKEVESGDSTAAMLGIFFMFLIPKDLSFWFGNPPPGAKNEALLDWGYIQRKLPWGVILLLGGGFAISDAADHSGLSIWIGEQMKGLESLPDELILIIVMAITALITEVASNVACANIILPILISLSETMNMHPLYLTIAATVSCSYAFMLPVATPPNAIVFAAGDIKIMDMVVTGAFLNVACVVVFFLLNITLGNVIYDYGNYDWPNRTSEAVPSILQDNIIHYFK